MCTRPFLTFFSIYSKSNQPKIVLFKCAQLVVLVASLIIVTNWPHLLWKILPLMLMRLLMEKSKSLLLQYLIVCWMRLDSCLSLFLLLSGLTIFSISETKRERNPKGRKKRNQLHLLTALLWMMNLSHLLQYVLTLSTVVLSLFSLPSSFSLPPPLSRMVV